MAFFFPPFTTPVGDEEFVVCTHDGLVHSGESCHVAETGFSCEPSIALNDLMSSLYDELGRENPSSGIKALLGCSSGGGQQCS